MPKPRIKLAPMSKPETRNLKLQKLAKQLLVFILLAALPALAIDREAFTFTRYKLTLNINPAEHALSAKGTVTLRNDSDAEEAMALLMETVVTIRNLRSEMNVSGSKPTPARANTRPIT